MAYAISLHDRNVEGVASPTCVCSHKTGSSVELDENQLLRSLVITEVKLMPTRRSASIWMIRDAGVCESNT